MNQLKPALMILFGSTGDLAAKKLFPSLYTLFTDGWLAPQTRILGIGRRDWSQADFQDTVLTAVRASQPVRGDDVSDFLEIFTYHQMDIGQPDDYTALWRTVEHMEEAVGFSHNRLFFLATAPELFPVVADQIGRGQPRVPGSFRRLMIEKPFGRDLASARNFNQHLRRYFEEEEILRIDHYLGKEMLQNILVLRFANHLFEPTLSAAHIDHIQITISEKIGIGQRGGYYDHSGALRDMVQNHILQLLALLTMERPERFDSEGLRDAKVKLFRSIRHFSPDSLSEAVVLGQYAAGPADEKAYRSEKGVDPESSTETFAALRFDIDNPRWQGTPVFVRTGKYMARRHASITIVYKESAYPSLPQPAEPNRLIIRIQPAEGVDLRYNIKKPGTELTAIPVEMDFCQTCNFPGQSAEAYVKLLMDAWRGDLNLFTRWDEIEATWTLIDSLLDQRDDLPVYPYPAGRDGPEQADEMMSRHQRQWLDV